MTKPRARYQGVTERVTTESASPPSPPDAIEGEASKKGARSIEGNGGGQVRRSSPPLFFNTEDNCEQKLCQELLRQAGSCLRIGLLVDGSQMLLQHAERDIHLGCDFLESRSSAVTRTSTSASRGVKPYSSTNAARSTAERASSSSAASKRNAPDAKNTTIIATNKTMQTAIIRTMLPVWIRARKAP